MSSRDQILRAIRRGLPQSSDLPSLRGTWTAFDDLEAQFSESLTAVGGQTVVASTVAEADSWLSQRNEWISARKTFSAIAGLGRSTFDLDAVDDPHQLSDVDFAVLSGRFAVAENGAVWTTDADLRHRVLLFIPQHLALVVPRGEIVPTMHHAYERPELTARFEGGRFGVFLSGPSKTADIEQSLVIGAHGPRSLTVFLIDPPN